MKLMSPKRLGKSGNILYYPKRQETYFYHVVYTPYETRLLRTPDIKGFIFKYTGNYLCLLKLLTSMKYMIILLYCNNDIDINVIELHNNHRLPQWCQVGNISSSHGSERKVLVDQGHMPRLNVAMMGWLRHISTVWRPNNWFLCRLQAIGNVIYAIILYFSADYGLLKMLLLLSFGRKWPESVNVLWLLSGVLGERVDSRKS